MQISIAPATRARQAVSLSSSEKTLHPASSARRLYQKPAGEVLPRARRSSVTPAKVGKALVVGLLTLANRTQAAIEPRMIGGAAGDACQWPSAVAVLSYDSGSDENILCSGVLVHPSVMLTATHCKPGNTTQIFFGQDYTSGYGASVASCEAAPNADVSACTLNTAIDSMPIVPLIFGCEAAALVVGKSVTQVGFGAQQNGSFGTKQIISNSVITSTHATSVVVCAEASCGEASGLLGGDSGSPLFVRLDAHDGLPGSTDGSWRLAGLGSASNASDTTSTSYYMPLAGLVSWVESSTGFDLTPCFTSSGAWSPTQDCGNFPVWPNNGTGDVLFDGCDVGLLSGLGAACGAPFAGPLSTASASSTITSSPITSATASSATSASSAATPLSTQTPSAGVRRLTPAVWGCAMGALVALGANAFS